MQITSPSYKYLLKVQRPSQGTNIKELNLNNNYALFLHWTLRA